MARCHLPLGTLAVDRVVGRSRSEKDNGQPPHCGHHLAAWLPSGPSAPCTFLAKWTPMARPMSGATHSLVLTIGGLS
jgi:hypothetical protein